MSRSMTLPHSHRHWQLHELLGNGSILEYNRVVARVP